MYVHIREINKMNRLEFSENELVQVDYSDILDKICAELKDSPFRFSQGRLLIGFDIFAQRVVESQPADPLGGKYYPRTATINFSSDCAKTLPDKIQAIYTILKNHLQDTLIKNNSSIEDFLQQIITDINNFKQGQTKLNFIYPFATYDNLGIQKLEIISEDKKRTINNKSDILTITIGHAKEQELKENIQKGLQNYIDNKFEDASQENLDLLQDTLTDLINSKKETDLDRIENILNQETLGKIKRYAQILYLKYIAKNINPNSPNQSGLNYLHTLIDRLEKMLEYIDNNDNGDLEVTYAGEKANFREIFYHSNSFDILPIIPIIQGSIGEETDDQKGERTFIFGMKLKLNGKVQARGKKPVFEYYMNLLNPKSDEHTQQLEIKPQTFVKKIFKILLLYFFVFDNRPDDPNYDPGVAFSTKIIPILQGNNDEKKKELFANIINGFKTVDVNVQIQQLKNLIKNILQKKEPLEKLEESFYIKARTTILESDIEKISTRQTFFKEVVRENPKKCLRYIAIEPEINDNGFCSLPVNANIRQVFFYKSNTQKKAEINMQYDLTGMKVLPILFLPLKNKIVQKIYNEHFASPNNLILFSYEEERLKKQSWEEKDSPEVFAYCFTYSLLTYVTLRILLQKPDKNLLIAMLRIHLGTDEKPVQVEKFLGHLSKTISHLFSQDYLANSQGIRIHNINKEYALKNSLSSLYSPLTKIFPGLKTNIIDKLAIIIVSSLESDAQYDKKQKISNLMGEIVTCNRQNQGIEIKQLKTFTDNYERKDIYSQPSILFDEVNKLHKEGYTHFVYIARSIYSSYLHITKKEQEEEDQLFFMSKDIIKGMKGDNKDIKIYPLFFDLYPTLTNDVKNPISMYIDNTEELMRLNQDNSQQYVVVYNLFNGAQVGSKQDKEDKIYNSIISYTTLLNFHTDVLKNENIYSGLIGDTLEKKDIFKYLLLFHFSRNEKASSNIHFKLNPYQDLIGDDSVGKTSMFRHKKAKIKFNSLAFLTEVRYIIDQYLDDSF